MSGSYSSHQINHQNKCPASKILKKRKRPALAMGDMCDLRYSRCYERKSSRSSPRSVSIIVTVNFGLDLKLR